MYELILIPAAFVLSAAGVALLLRLSHKFKWYDQIDERKIHQGSIPRLGGLGFALSFILIALVLALFREKGFRFFPCIIGMCLTLGSGIIDDFRPLRPLIKLIIQIIAALCVVIPGYMFSQFFFTADFGRFLPAGHVLPVYLQFFLTLFWIVGITNAVNFIDGVDGLAGGVAVLAALFFALIFNGSSGGFVFLLYLCLAAAVLGFLVFNAPFPRAKIFMGDGGSQFLGFTLAVLPLIGNGGAPAVLPLFYSSALLLIPILDTVAAVWRRVRDRRRIGSPDQGHIHHKLLNLGFSASAVDACLWGLQIIIGILVYVSVHFRNRGSLALLCAAYTVPGAFFILIHFLNRKTMAAKNAGGNFGKEEKNGIAS
jgi:UDP-GlcNAc:undecaprenyl-phosphate GlcNAc-1-phosphate transferase